MTLDHRNSDPVDHARTFRQHAGETFTYGANVPGLAGSAVAVVAMTVGVFAVAAGHLTGGAIALIVAAVVGAVSAGWARCAKPNCAGTPRIPTGRHRRPAAERRRVKFLRRIGVRRARTGYCLRHG